MNEPSPSPTPALPRLLGHHLVVGDAPRLLLGGQVHNSVPSSPTDVTLAWQRLHDMNVGLVIGSASWAQVESQEDTFDFSSVDVQIAEARRLGIQLVLIWFGAFKNAASTYAPRWVRSDTGRFPRAVVHPKGASAWTYEGQTPKPVLSVFSADLRRADQRAFTAFMTHLARQDDQHTVVMVQVENEVGLMGDSRDRSDGARQAWAAEVPHQLLTALADGSASPDSPVARLWHQQGSRTSGSWSEVFGDGADADEVFMAWAFAGHCESLASSGKEIKPLPMYTNAWLGPQPGQPSPGDYPSGGPVAGVLDVWKIAAPSLDFLAPDIYVDDVKQALEGYAREDNPLFIPETRLRAGSLFYALGHHRAFGFSVFGLEDARVDAQLAQAYGVLRGMGGVIADAQRDGRIEGILLEDSAAQRLTLGGYDITVRGARDLLVQLLLDAGVSHPPPAPASRNQVEAPEMPPTPGDDRPFGLIVWEGDDTFLVVGQNLTFDFAHPGSRVEIDHVEEGTFGENGWTAGRAINGDERLSILPMSGIRVVRIRVLTTPGPTGSSDLSRPR
ncbi:MAG: hypothetical protein JWR42_128 [Marmoricola sp.]|nr:hypothetical protein [Marmoricola sp.]